MSEKKPNDKLRYERESRGWSQKKVADQIDAGKEMVSRWECGERQPVKYYQEKLCLLYNKSAHELGFISETDAVPSTPSKSTDPASLSSLVQQDIQSILPLFSQAVSQGIIGAVKELDDRDLDTLRRLLLKSTLGLALEKILPDEQQLSNITKLFISSEEFLPQRILLAEPWADDLLSIYARGIAACQDLYFHGNPHQVEAILPLYSTQTAAMAQQTSPLQRAAATLASQAHRLACELATNREDFGTAQQTGQQAFSYAQLAGDVNLQVAALISLANLGFHLSSTHPHLIRQHSAAALRAYKQAVSLLDKNVTPLLKGRTYAGIAEVHAMRGELQEAMQAMGLAYEHFPMKPEDDPAYPYLRASRYALYVFGDAQSRLFLGQPKEANKALIAMQQETNDPQIEPITKLDMLYYQAEVQIQQRELELSSTILTEAALLAKELGSRLYFNKLALSYHQLQEQWPREPSVVALEEAFQPW